MVACRDYFTLLQGHDLLQVDVCVAHLENNRKHAARAATRRHSHATTAFSFKTRHLRHAARVARAAVTTAKLRDQRDDNKRDRQR